MASITIDNATKTYGSFDALKDFSLDVEDGEFVVLVGSSGCGKSTMLKILAGLDAASSGRVMIGPNEVTDLAPGERDIAMVFQNYALYPHLTVRKNMGFGLKMRGMHRSEIDRKVDQAARILGLDVLLERRPKMLSGGQRQRVALGRAIVREPQAFLMDEPLSNLDAKLRVQMRAEIGALHKRIGVTTIYVTHDQIEAMTMADRIVIMRDGEIQQIADPDTMFQRPVNQFVAGFIGSPGMNFMKAKLADNDGVSIRAFGQNIAIPKPNGGLKAAVGRDVVLGIRPEHIGIDVGPVSFDLTPNLVESLGSEKYIYFTPPEENLLRHDLQDGGEDRRGDALIARVHHHASLAAGDPLKLSIDPAQIYVFDAETQRTLN